MKSFFAFALMAFACFDVLCGENCLHKEIPLHFDKVCAGARKLESGAIRVESEGQTRFCEAEIPLDIINGNYVSISADIRCVSLGVPGGKYGGAKFQLHICGEDGIEKWHGANIETGGNFHNIKVSRMFSEVKRAVLQFGLQDTSGALEIKNLKISYCRPWAPELPEGFKCQYTPEFSASPTMRGFMSPYRELTEADLKVLKEWGANIVRYQFNRNWDKENVNMDVEEFFSWVDSKVAAILSLSEAARKAGVRFAVDMHTPVGGRAYGDMRMFHEKKYADAFVEAWRRIARALKGEPCVWAYDLINEPAQCSVPAEADWLELQWRAAKAIREIDPKTPIIVNGSDWGCPSGFKNLKPLPLPDIIYQAHMYMPFEFTHQGVFDFAREPVSYPSNFKGKSLDKSALEEYLKPVVDFQKKWGARIYLGEFSAIRWAEGSEKYISDCIEIFEKHGWDWSYHAFREWQGWDVEVGGGKDKPIYGVDTPRKKVLLEAFKKNAKKF